jgi:hypothetical protein
MDCNLQVAACGRLHRKKFGKKKQRCSTNNSGFTRPCLAAVGTAHHPFGGPQGFFSLRRWAKTTGLCMCARFRTSALLDIVVMGWMVGKRDRANGLSSPCVFVCLCVCVGNFDARTEVAAKFAV